jgi:hypothetical protein
MSNPLHTPASDFTKLTPDWGSQGSGLKPPMSASRAVRHCAVKSCGGVIGPDEAMVTFPTPVNTFKRMKKSSLEGRTIGAYVP